MSGKKSIITKFISLFTVCAVLSCAAAAVGFFMLGPFGLANIILIVLAVASIIIAVYAAAELSGKVARPLRGIIVELDNLVAGQPNQNLTVKGASAELAEIAEKMQIDAVRMAYHISLFERLGKGDYAFDFEIGEEEDGIVLVLADTIKRQRELVQSLSAVSGQIMSASGEIAGGSQNLASGSNEQAAEVEQFRATVESLREQAEKTAEMARQSIEGILEYQRIVDGISADVSTLRKTMEDINESGKRISKVSDVIENIAFQTNILALNAAVEAARAGQHGKGFAVVADEVRDLSNRSAEAARQTAEIIRADWENIQTGNKLAEEALAGSQNISNIAKENLRRMENLSESSNAQSRAINEISVGINQISLIVQNNASLAEESAAASQELSARAIELDKITEFYKIK